MCNTCIIQAKPFMFKGDSVEINYSRLVDSALKGDYAKSEMELMIYCAAVSVYRPSKLRPRMKQVKIYISNFICCKLSFKAFKI